MHLAPSEAVMVGDNFENDIRPAADLGMKTIWLNVNNKMKNDVESCTEIEEISQIHKYI